MIERYWINGAATVFILIRYYMFIQSGCVVIIVLAYTGIRVPSLKAEPPKTKGLRN